MKLASSCVFCVALIMLELASNRAQAWIVEVDCDYNGPVLDGTPLRGLECELTWESGVAAALYADYKANVSYPAGPAVHAIQSPRHFYMGSTVQPQIWYLLCTSFTGLHQIFMEARTYEREVVDSGGRVIWITRQIDSDIASGDIVAYPCGSL